jgi:hypothetical protein
MNSSTHESLQSFVLAIRVGPEPSDQESTLDKMASKLGIVSRDVSGADWMSQTLSDFFCLSLREICLPGTHDAGMSEDNYGDSTSQGSSGRTIAQHLAVGDQLAHGIRYIDIRPTLSHGQLFTGHFSHVASPIGWQGANGQSIQSIINDVNAFTSAHNELVILAISHAYDLDGQECQIDPGPGTTPKRDDCEDNGGTWVPTWADDVTDFQQDQWNTLITALEGINHRWDIPDQYQDDVSTATLGDMITDGPAVIIICHVGDGISLGDAQNHGFVTDKQMPIYDNYADSDDYDTMMFDQKGKLAQMRQSPHDPMFMYNAMLTQDSWDTFWDTTTVLDMGDGIFPTLVEELTWSFLTHPSFPNIILVDALTADDEFVNTVVGINFNQWSSDTC